MADDANEVANMYDPDSCRNFDVVGVVDRLDRVLYELCTSESAVTNEFNKYDRERYTTMTSEVDQYIKVVQEQERLDLPHSYFPNKLYNLDYKEHSRRHMPRYMHLHSLPLEQVSLD